MGNLRGTASQSTTQHKRRLTVKTFGYLALFPMLIIFAGCGERNSPIINGGYFQLVSEIQTPGFARDVYVANDTAYVADNLSGIAVIDIRDASDPIYVKSLPTVTRAIQIYVSTLN